MIPIIPSIISRLYLLLPRQYRLRIWMTGLTIFIMSVFDLIGIGVLVPVLLLVLNEDAVTENRYMSGLFNWCGFEDFFSFMIFICVVILLFSIGRIVICTWLQYKQNKRLFTIPVICPYAYIVIIIQRVFFISNRITVTS